MSHQRTSVRVGLLVIVGAVCLTGIGSALGQLIDRTQAPNAANEGIAKSLAEQSAPVAATCSRRTRPRSSSRAIRSGRSGAGGSSSSASSRRPRPGTGRRRRPRRHRQRDDAHRRGSGRQLRRLSRPAARIGGIRRRRRDPARQPRCAASLRPRPQGDAGRRDHRATCGRSARRRWPGARSGRRRRHAHAAQQGHRLRHARRPPGRHRSTPAASRASIPICACGRSSRTAATSRSASSSVGALQDEMGLQMPSIPTWRPRSAGGRVDAPRRAWCSTARSIGSIAAVRARRRPGDAVSNEIPTSLVDYHRVLPAQLLQAGALPSRPRQSRQGRRLFEQIGCTRCHVPDLQIDRDRRVADVETVYDPERGIFNSLFATARPLAWRARRRPARAAAAANARYCSRSWSRNIFTDFKRHDLGPTSTSATTTARCDASS